MVALVLAVWIPHFAHYCVDRSPVEMEVVAAMGAAPASAVLEEVSSMHLAIYHGISSERVVETAEAALKGVHPFSNLTGTTSRLLGYPADLRIGSSSSQLALAALSVERLLLDAYELSGDQRFLRLALRRVLTFSAYEARQFGATDFLWNDHAVAARISVLTQLWRAIRDEPSISMHERREIVSLVQRSGRLLALPAHFTVRTNHGVMQNLALLQIGAAFPALPEAAHWRDLGIARLRLQIKFYVSPEGFILEHSSEYHAFGAELMAQAVRLCNLNGISPPPWLVDAAHRSAKVLAPLMRPDGSLPLVGNTSAGSRFSIPVVPEGGESQVREMHPHWCNDQRESFFLPVAGYAFWWNQERSKELCSQVVINWSKFDGHGHKHADEGAVQLWANGIDWVTSTGYWPYGLDGMSDAYGWRSSNAPHHVGEDAAEQRELTLLSTITDANVYALDLLRTSQRGGNFRRQIVQLDPGTLLILDFAIGNKDDAETIWTLGSQVELTRSEGAGLFVASVAGVTQKLWISIDPAPLANITLHRGSRLPFSGWVVVNNEPKETNSIRVTIAPDESVSASLFSLRQNAQSSSAQIRIVHGSKPEHWSAAVYEETRVRKLERNGKILLIHDQSGIIRSLPWVESPSVVTDRKAIKADYLRAISIYPPWRDLSKYRLKLSYLLIGIALVIELLWQISARSRFVTPTTRSFLTRGIFFFWASFAIWAIFFYLC